MRTQKMCVILGLSLLVLSVSPLCHAQLNSTTTPVNLNAVVAETLTVLAAPATVDFTLIANATATGSTPITVTTTWSLNSTRTSVSLHAYFTNPAIALANPLGTSIPASSLKGSVNGGTFTGFTGVSPFVAGGSLTIFTESLTALTLVKTRNDTLNLQIDTTGQSLTAGVYVGLLILQAQAL